MNYPLCSECNLPILPDDEKIKLENSDRDDSPWQGFQYHAECYDLRDGQPASETDL